MVNGFLHRQGVVLYRIQWRRRASVGADQRARARESVQIAAYRDGRYTQRLDQSFDRDPAIALQVLDNFSAPLFTKQSIQTT